jgi:hypothetical protein
MKVLEANQAGRVVRFFFQSRFSHACFLRVISAQQLLLLWRENHETSFTR